MKNIMDAFDTIPANICRNFLSNHIGCLADMKIDKSKTILISDQIWWKINAIMCKKQSYTNNPTMPMNDATSYEDFSRASNKNKIIYYRNILYQAQVILQLNKVANRASHI